MSHHSPEHDEEISNAMREMLDQELGPTKTFPEGKLTENDEGGIQVGIGVVKGKVVINFGAPITWIGLNPAQAISFGQTLIKRAREAQNEILK